MVSNLSSAVAKALPITLREFEKSLASIWRSIPQKASLPTTLGLAISGGVDSMALASLCSRLQTWNSSDWRLRAFIVDHGARPGSDEEAKAVAALVNDKGIETNVLKIKWPKDIVPSTLSKFESLARKYRFQILGKACRDSNIRSLLLAHHEDDNFETVLMRLVNGHGGRGLLGIRQCNRIPECSGIYGVYESGDSIELGETPKQSRQHLQDVEQEPAGNGSSMGQLRLEDGGINVLRPLLQYSKDRLIATCLEDGTPWFEDHTNANPALTQRNAIRHLYKRHVLPAALRKENVLALSMSMQQRKASLDRKALKMLVHCKFRYFEPRAGSIYVRFPQLGTSQIKPVNGDDNSAMDPTQREVAHELLKYAINVVSPSYHSQYPLEGPCNYVFPELNPAKQGKQVNFFTVAGVMFEKTTLVFPEEFPSLVPMQGCVWFMRRQPYSRSSEQQPLLKLPRRTSFKNPNDSWQFYDGRYWIRVLNHSPTATLKVRPLRDSDLQAMHSKKLPSLRRLLQAFAPGKIRFTLPVIVMESVEPEPEPESESESGRSKEDHLGSNEGGSRCSYLSQGHCEWKADPPAAREKVLAFPTLDYMLEGAEKIMSYEIAYKRVEWPALRDWALRKQGSGLSG